MKSGNKICSMAGIFIALVSSNAFGGEYLPDTLNCDRSYGGKLLIKMNGTFVCESPSSYDKGCPNLTLVKAQAKAANKNVAIDETNCTSAVAGKTVKELLGAEYLPDSITCQESGFIATIKSGGTPVCDTSHRGGGVPAGTCDGILLTKEQAKAAGKNVVIDEKKCTATVAGKTVKELETEVATLQKKLAECSNHARPGQALNDAQIKEVQALINVQNKDTPSENTNTAKPATK